uniref:Murine leukemia virus integrase C-terminal domain-containing protein n=1 Tax=Serinus canaria TaxID=9135 RepID=A0A8C9L4R3_SERCA
MLDITWNLHTPWRLQSSGQVERMNQTLKNQIKKISWDGPHQVILTTFTAVKVAGIDSWIHYTRVKKVPAQWETQVLSPTRMIIRAKEPHYRILEKR